MLWETTERSPTGWSSAAARTSCSDEASPRSLCWQARSSRLKVTRPRTDRIVRTAAALLLRTAGNYLSEDPIPTFLWSSDNETPISTILHDCSRRSVTACGPNQDLDAA